MKTLFVSLSLSLLFAATLILSPPMVRAEAKRMQVAVIEVTFIMQKDKYKNLGYGYLGDYLMAAAEAVDVDLDLKYYPPKRAHYEFINNNMAFTISHPDTLVGLEIDKSDIGYLPLVKTRFLLHYYKPKHPQGIEFDSFDDLSEYKISAHRGSPSGKLYDEHSIEILEYNNPVSGVDMLKTGRVDLVEIADMAMTPIVLNEFPGELDNFVAIDKPIYKFETGFVYKLSNEKSVAIINAIKQGLEIISNNGKADEIMRRYFGDNVPNILMQH